MKETIDYFRQQAIEAKDIAKLQWKAFCFAFVVVAAVYLGSVFIETGWPTYLLSVPAALLMAVTSLVRLNAIGPECMGFMWHLRRLGLITAGTGSVMILSTPFLEAPLFPTWRAVIILNGVAICWLTSPGQPPFWKYWTGDWRNDPPPRPPLGRVIDRMTGTHSVGDLKDRLNENRPPDEGDS